MSDGTGHEEDLSPAEEERLINLPGLVLTGEEASVEEVETLHLPLRSWVLLWGSVLGVLAVLVGVAFFVAM
jgi:hypothetical protein